MQSGPRFGTPGYDKCLRLKPCVICGEIAMRHQRSTYCNPCNAIVGKLASRARAAVGKAIKLGILKPAKLFKCTDCHAQADRYDHRDYGQYLAVDPVCVTCNNRRGPAKITTKA